MKSIPKKTLASKSVKDLVALRNKTRAEYFELRMKHAMRGLKQTHLLKIARRNIAKINTYLSLKLQG